MHVPNSLYLSKTPMLNNWLDRIGDWNPQLLRELKGRLKVRNVVLAVLVAIVAQAFLILFFYSELPNSPDSYSRFWLDDPITKAKTINWQHWWLDIFRVITWGLPHLAMTAGPYMLITDLGQEERRGTFNFLRLSPQSAFSIIHGKLLGVPVLVYLAIGLCLPLHVVATISAGIPLNFLISFYGLVTLATYLASSVACFFTFLSKQSFTGSAIPVEAGTALAHAFLMLSTVVPGFMFWNVATTWQSFSEYLIGDSILDFRVDWFFLNVSTQPILAHLFVVANLGLMLYIVWQALYRSFHMPAGSIFSKGQSYWLSVYPEILLMGFLFQQSFFAESAGRSADWADNVEGSMTITVVIAILASWHVLKSLALTAMLTPNRQTVLDWTRYHHLARHSRQLGESSGQQQSQTTSGNDRHHLRWDLMFGERSPALLTIAINLVVTALIWLPILVLISFSTHQNLKTLLAFLLSLGLSLIYAAITQLILLLKTRHRLVWAISVVGGLVFAPFILLVMMANGLPTGPIAHTLLFTPFLWTVLNQISGLAIGLAGLAQIATIASLTWHLNKRLNKMGASTSKALLSEEPSALKPV